MKNRYFLLISFFALFLSCKSETELNDTELNKKSEEIALNELAFNQQNEKLKQLNNEIANSRRNAITDAIEKSSPAVVGINVTETRRYVYRDYFDDPFLRFFRRYRSRNRIREYEVKGVGSGFLISDDGYILTNHHVAGNATKVIVTLTDGKEYQAQIIGADAVTDVCLLKIDSKNLPYLKMCQSDVLIGEWAIALGNPFGLFDKNAKPTVTVGVVSNKGVDFIQEDENDLRIYRNMIQTDAAISSGNSGGPLINALGEVIGMNTIIYSTATDNKGAGSIGIGFSIPADRVMKIVEMLKSNKKLDRNFYLGMEVEQSNERYQAYFNLETSKGIFITKIYIKSAAHEAGLEPGDVIQKINGYNIYDKEDYVLAVNDNFIGDKLEFTILRDGKSIKKSLILEELRK